MKIIFASLLFFVLFCAGVCAQSVEEEKTSDKIGVEEISLTRALDKDGKMSGASLIFSTTDVPIYCFVRLASTKAVAVKMNLVAASAAGLRPNQRIVSVNYKTAGRQESVTFDASPNGKTWAAGKYRVDILLDGKTAKSMEFEIRKTEEIAKEKSPPAKAKPKTKPRRN